MTMSATLTATPTSGNEMPGYPRVLSDPPRSLNCNGYPGLTEYGGNSINTTANNQSTTNTSTSQMQLPASATTQSPSRQTPTSRPNSSSNHMSYHMSPTAQSPSASTTPVNNNQHYPTSGMITPTSHHQSHQDGSDWNNQNAWNGNPQSNEMFNQSDRINLNTRLKTMILNKSDKEQSTQQQTGHFLSYSHQNLSSDSQQQLSSENNNNESIKEAGTGDDGGFKVNDSWKSSIIKQEDQQNRSKDFFEHKQQLNEKNIGIDPGGGKEENSKKEEDYSSENNQQHQTYPSSEFSATTKIEKPSLDDKPSYAYNSAHEYQQHQSMVNSIKKEPNVEVEATSVKFEGYEKNYQNFIRYADFCDSAQQPASAQPPPSTNPQYQDNHVHPKQSQFHQQDYIQSQGYYNYPYQNYPQNYHHSQNYQPAFMASSQQAAAAYQPHHPHHPHHSSLTNFEQQIPLHTYPIPKTSSASGATIKSDLTIKSEQNSHNIHPYPFLSENMNAAAAHKDNTGHFSSRPINPINEVPTIEDSSCINHPATKEQVSSKVRFKVFYSDSLVVILSCQQIIFVEI